MVESNTNGFNFDERDDESEPPRLQYRERPFNAVDPMKYEFQSSFRIICMGSMILSDLSFGWICFV